MAISIDLLPTIASIVGVEAPADRIIDGRDIWPLMTGRKGSVTPHEAFYYYYMDNIEAVRSANWKLHIRKGEEEVKELYDLEADIGERNNVYQNHLKIVSRLTELVKSCREDLGDWTVGAEGKNCRSCGTVIKADTLTHYNPKHPYIEAMYDLEDFG